MTLVLRIALPCIYLSFFGLFILSIFLLDTNIALLSNPIFRGVSILVYILFIAIFYFTLWKLRRVEYLGEQFYISNYFKNYRYDLNGVDHLKIYNLGIATIGRIALKEKGAWGKHIYFLAKSTNLESFRSKYPSLLV